MTKTTDDPIVAYVYDNQVFCTGYCIIGVLAYNDLTTHEFIAYARNAGMSTEDALDNIADYRKFDRAKPASFSSNDFPKAVLASHLLLDDMGGHCRICDKTLDAPQLDLSRIAERVCATGIKATIADSGGGCQTIFVGPIRDFGSESQHAVMAGPGVRREGKVVGYANDFYVGSGDPEADEGGTVVKTEDAAVAAIVKLAMADQRKHEIGHHRQAALAKHGDPIPNKAPALSDEDVVRQAREWLQAGGFDPDPLNLLRFVREALSQRDRRGPHLWQYVARQWLKEYV